MQAHFPVLSILILMLGACATGGPSTSDTAPVSRVPVEDISPPDAPSTTAQDPSQDSTHDARAAGAAASLLAAAQTAAAEDDTASAVVLLERAIRLDPRNGELWVALADVHLQAGRMQTAAQHVRKAIALAGDDYAEQRRAWLQMAAIREAEGAVSEARSIRRRYARVRG